MSNIPAGVKVHTIGDIQREGNLLVNALIEAKLPNGSTWDALQRGLVLPDFNSAEREIAVQSYLEAYLQASFTLIKSHLVGIRYRKVGSDYPLPTSCGPSIYPAHTLEWALLWNGYGDKPFTAWQPCAAMVDALQPMYAEDDKAAQQVREGIAAAIPKPVGPHGALDQLTD